MFTFHIKLFIIFTLILLSCSCGILESEEDENSGFVVLFGAEHADAGHAILQTQDYGFIVSGSGNGTIGPADGTISNPMITKLSKSGKVEWTTLLQQRGLGYAAGHVSETTSNDFFMLLNVDSKAKLVKIDREGKITNSSVYERPERRNANLQKTAEGNYIIVGTYGDGTFLTKIDEMGSVIWDREFDQSYGFASSVLVTEDNGYVVLGSKSDDDAEQYNLDLIVFKTDHNGKVQWRKVHGDSLEQETVSSIIHAGDGDFIVAGQTTRTWNTDVNFDELILKIDSNGNLKWRKSFVTSAFSTANSVVASRDGFIFTGSNGGDISVKKIDLIGNVIWTKRVNPTAKHGWGTSIIAMSNGKFAVTGSYGEGGGQGGGEFDAFLLIIDDDGNLD